MSHRSIISGTAGSRATGGDRTAAATLLAHFEAELGAEGTQRCLRLLSGEAEDDADARRVLQMSTATVGLSPREVGAAEWSDAWESRWIAHPDRRRAGVFYTPVELARRLVRASFAALDRLPDCIVDPACGTGALLGPARDELVRAGLSDGEASSRLVGIDTDGVALAIARLRLGPEATLVRADALDMGALRDFGRPDLVLANPPFGNAIGEETRRSESERADYLRRYPLAATGAYDRAGLFLELGAQLVRDDGVLGYIVPRALLAAPYARQLREALGARWGRPAIVEDGRAGGFRAAEVTTVSIVVGGQRDRSHHEAGRWAAGLSRWSALDDVVPSAWPQMAEFAHIRANATAGEAYEIAASVCEARADEAFRLVTTGLIDPFRLKWGEQAARYLKRRYERPIVPPGALTPTRRELAASPKVVVGGLSRVLEAAVDPDGRVAGAVATLAVIPRSTQRHVPLSRLAAIVNSALTRALFDVRWGALALGGSGAQVTKKKLAAIPVPPSWFEPSSGSRFKVDPGPATNARRWPAGPWRQSVAERAAGLRGVPAGDRLATLDALAEADGEAALADGRIDALLLSLVPAVVLDAWWRAG